jgi:hypothetical protein
VIQVHDVLTMRVLAAAHPDWAALNPAWVRAVHLGCITDEESTVSNWVWDDDADPEVWGHPNMVWDPATEPMPRVLATDHRCYVCGLRMP